MKQKEKSLNICVSSIMMCYLDQFNTVSSEVIASTLKVQRVQGFFN